jgi:diaminopimelate decarboxylase
MNEVLRDGRLGGHDPRELAERFGTPFFAYDLDVVTHHVEALRSILPASFDLAYAVKANPNLSVLQHLAGLGLGADVASGGELRHVLRTGFDPGQVVFTGPGKRDEELQAAVEAGIRVVTVESPGELRRLASIAAALGRRQPVLLRAAVEPGGAGGGDDAAVGITGKFGMDVDDLRDAAAEAVASPWLEPLGVHAFGASNVTDARLLVTHIEATVELASRVAAEAGFTLRLMDAGGGLGIPYADGEPALDLGDLGWRLAALADRMAASPATRGTRVLLEPGRYLVGQSGAYVACVVDRKRMGDGHVVILDGGIHHVLRPVLVGQGQRVVVLTGGVIRPGDDRLEPATAPVLVAGPLCTGLDVFARDAHMVAPEPDDLVAVLDVGAYGATESMPFFLSHPLPAEVALRGGEAWLARRRIDPEAWLDWQSGADTTMPSIPPS